VGFFFPFLPKTVWGEKIEFSLQPRLLINFATERDLLMTDRPTRRITQHWKCARNASARKSALLICVLIMRLQMESSVHRLNH
jgi:hypothetical protein